MDPKIESMVRESLKRTFGGYLCAEVTEDQIEEHINNLLIDLGSESSCSVLIFGTEVGIMFDNDSDKSVFIDDLFCDSEETT